MDSYGPILLMDTILHQLIWYCLDRINYNIYFLEITVVLWLGKLLQDFVHQHGVHIPWFETVKVPQMIWVSVSMTLSFQPTENFILSNPYNILGMCWGIHVECSLQSPIYQRHIKLMEACLCQILNSGTVGLHLVWVFSVLPQISVVMGQTSGCQTHFDLMVFVCIVEYWLITKPEEFELNLNGDFMGSSAPIAVIAASQILKVKWRLMKLFLNLFRCFALSNLWLCGKKTLNMNKCLLRSQEVGSFHIHVGNVQATCQSLQL